MEVKEFVNWLNSFIIDKEEYYTLKLTTGIFNNSNAVLTSERHQQFGSGNRLIRLNNNHRSHDFILGDMSIYIENGNSKGCNLKFNTEEEYVLAVSRIISFIGNKVYKSYHRNTMHDGTNKGWGFYSVEGCEFESNEQFVWRLK
jgi:hypothetical protein